MSIYGTGQNMTKLMFMDDNGQNPMGDLIEWDRNRLSLRLPFSAGRGSFLELKSCNFQIIWNIRQKFIFNEKQ